MFTGLWYTLAPNFGALSSFLRCKEPPCPLSHDFELWRMLEYPQWGLVPWSWFGYDHWSLIHRYSEFWFSILILKVQRRSRSSQFWLWLLENAGYSWLGFGILSLILMWSLDFDTNWQEFFILISIWIWPLVFVTPMFQIFHLYIDFEGAKTYMSSKSGFEAFEDSGGSWLGLGILI